MPARNLRDFFKKWPKFYYFISITFGPLLLSGLSGALFLKRYPRSGTTLNIGSGPRIYRDSSVKNVDIYQYPGVLIIAPAENIPLADGSVARIISDTVLEHVTDPQAAVAEMHRLLEAGGIAYITVPFLYPYHSAPSDYQRWSKFGLRELFKDFEMVEVGVRAGPFSALTAYLNHLIGIIFSFGSPALNSLLTNLVMFVTFPLKLPDILFNYWPDANQAAAVLYCVIKKKD